VGERLKLRDVPGRVLLARPAHDIQLPTAALLRLRTAVAVAAGRAAVAAAAAAALDAADTAAAVAAAADRAAAGPAAAARDLSGLQSDRLRLLVATVAARPAE
jgi:hypothetical protein